ncbi:acyl-CoA N-acyltransferase [Thozetella sp. PMI_491]|nr:acyl-CoA N-acyltransferase [Thozetella sp. PMI_491]
MAVDLSVPSDHLPSLRTLLQSCVNPDPAGSSIGFHAPLSDADADEFWQHMAEQLGTTLHTFILAPAAPAGPDPAPGAPEIVGTVSLAIIPKVTHRHRAEVVKLMVRPAAQGRGLGKRLMAHVEHFAKAEMGKEMLNLDTATDLPTMEFYRRLGWKEWGTCPEYAEFADGRRGDATFFVKFLR